MRLVIATYDGGVCGWDSVSSSTDGVPAFEVTFAYKPHMGGVKALAASGSRPGGRDLLVSGSLDETVRVYDLARGKELGSLVEHTDTVTAVDWYRHSHLLSGGLDGKICVWRSSDWSCLLTLHHPGGVASLAVHPSGRLAFSVGIDTTYRLWDILKGNVALQRKLGFKVKKVAWSPNGERFLLVAEDHVQVRSLVDDSFVCDLPHDNTVSDAIFVGDDHVATSESTSLVVRLWPVADGISEVHARLVAPGQRRVRALAYGEEDGESWIASVATGGLVGVWNAGSLIAADAVAGGDDNADAGGVAPLATLAAKGAGASFRATCIALSTTITTDDAGTNPPPASEARALKRAAAEAAAEEEKKAAAAAAAAAPAAAAGSAKKKKKNSKKKSSSAKKRKAGGAVTSYLK